MLDGKCLFKKEYLTLFNAPKCIQIYQNIFMYISMETFTNITAINRVSNGVMLTNVFFKY